MKKSELSRRDMFFLLNDVGVGKGEDNRHGGGGFGDVDQELSLIHI